MASERNDLDLEAREDGQRLAGMWRVTRRAARGPRRLAGHKGLRALVLTSVAFWVAAFAGGNRQAAFANGDCNTAAYGNGCVAPANVTDTVSGQNVQLRWQMPSLAALPYAQIVERGISPFQLSVIQTFGSGPVQTSYTDQNVAPGTYYYAVCNVYPNLDEQTEDDECAFALPEGVQVRAPTSGSNPPTNTGNPPAGGQTPPTGPNPLCNLASQTPDANHVIIYADSGYNGLDGCVLLGIGNYPSAASFGIPNDSLSSFEVGGNVQLVICEDPNYQGACSTFTGDVARMTGSSDEDANLNRVTPTSGPGMDNDQMSSMCVQRRGTPPTTPCGSSMTAPTNLVESDRSQTAITLQFGAGSGGDFERVTCRGDARDPGCGLAIDPSAPHSGAQPIHYLAPDARSDTFVNLQPDRSYRFQVCEGLTSGYEPAACSTWVDYHTLPPVPTDLHLESVSATSLAIGWSTNVTDAGSPIVYIVSRNGTEVSPPGGIRPVNLTGIVEREHQQPRGEAVYPRSASFIDTFAVNTSQRYVYQVCATDPQATDGNVSACASYRPPLVDLNSPKERRSVEPFIP